MQQNSADAEARYQTVMGSVTSDAGLMMDRVRYLRANNSERRQRNNLRRASTSSRSSRPTRADSYDMLIELAGDAEADRNWRTAFNIASQLDDVLPAGASAADQPIGDPRRLHHPRLACRHRRARPDEPSVGRAFDVLQLRPRRAVRCRCRPRAITGPAEQPLHPGIFRMRTPISSSPQPIPSSSTASWRSSGLVGRLHRRLPRFRNYVTTQVQRDAFNSRRLVQAVRLLGQQGRSTEQALFVRALAESLDNDTDRNLAVQLGEQIRRQDLAVWTARMARVKGSAFYVRQAYPMLNASVSGELWSLAHGISRQESSFDPYAISHAGARGMMQLMTGTAREQAGKLGIGFDSYRLLSDPSYNVMIGSAYFQRMLNTWNGSVPLAVAAYNAGSGNVRKWINTYGDPRGQVDMIKWIEAIPYSETRAYVQRVIENSVVYDSMRSAQPQQTAIHVSRYLGKSQPG